MSILQLKITLEDSKPPIWRRFLVEDSINFNKLHEIIQVVMDWENYHLYMFAVNGMKIGMPDPGWDSEDLKDSRIIKLNTLFKNQKFEYEYDFGDSWEHTISVEKILDGVHQTPVCIEGKRSCPPEDCGGVWGYGEFLKAIKDPKHKQHKEMMDWIGGKFDPEEFNLTKINKLLQGA